MFPSYINWNKRFAKKHVKVQEEMNVNVAEEEDFQRSFLDLIQQSKLCILGETH